MDFVVGLPPRLALVGLLLEGPVLEAGFALGPVSRSVILTGTLRQHYTKVRGRHTLQC